MNQTKKTARLAGLLYLIWIITGLYGIFYVPSRIHIQGDAAETAANILANEFLFRTSITNDIVSGALWVFLVLVLYRLFRQVDEHQSRLLVALVLVQIPAAFFMEALNITSLMILKGEMLKTFDLAQRQDVAQLFLKIGDYGTLTLVFFWGLWLFPLGILTYRSRFLPRFLGVWLIANGVVYLIIGFTGLLLPQHLETVKTISFPVFFGEVAFMLWLLIVGAKPKPSVETVSEV
jgi:hypothetical protein